MARPDGERQQSPARLTKMKNTPWEQSHAGKAVEKDILRPISARAPRRPPQPAPQDLLGCGAGAEHPSPGSAARPQRRRSGSPKPPRHREHKPTLGLTEESPPRPRAPAILDPRHAARLLRLLGWSAAFLLSRRSSTAITPRLSSANGERLPSFIFLSNGKCESEISVCEHFSEKTNIFIGAGQPANQAQNCWLLFLS